MAFDVNKPADDQTIALGPADIRENFRALKDDKIVNALKVNDYSPGNANGNIAVNNGSVNTNLNADKVDGHDAGNAANNVMVLDGNALTPLANIPSELTGKNAATATTAANATNHINNASGAHAGSAISITATSYGKGLSTAETTIQKVADRVNQNGTPQFVTDASKCGLLLNFKNGLADSVNGIVPANYNSAVRWSDDFVNDNSSKEVATNLSCSLKQFEGDEGLFGSGIAVEESRTNLFTYSDDLTNAAWVKNNCTVTLDRILPDGRKLFKVTAVADGYLSLSQYSNASGLHCASIFIHNTTNKPIAYQELNLTDLTYIAPNSKITRIFGSATISGTRNIGWVLSSATAGDTFYITSPQLEAGAFPTSYIATGATAVTRPAGQFKIEGKNIPKVGSISFWGKMSKSSHAFQHFFDINSANNGLCVNYTASTNKFFVGIGAYNQYELDNYNENINHFAITYDYTNNVFKAYYNGILKGTLTGTSFTPQDWNNLLIGGGYYDLNGDQPYFYKTNVTISNFAIFNYALTTDEISQIYNSGLEGKPVVCANEAEGVKIDRLITKSGLAGESVSQAANGYKIFSDGTIIQWGQASWLSSESSKLIFFPVAFPLEPKSISVLPYTTSMTYTPSKISAAHGGNYFTAYRDTSDAPINFYWFAIGY